MQKSTSRILFGQKKKVINSGKINPQSWLFINKMKSLVRWAGWWLDPGLRLSYLNRPQETAGSNSLQGEKVTKVMDSTMRDGQILQVFKVELCEKQPEPTNTWRGALWTSGNWGGKAWETTSAVPGMAERIEVTASEIPSLATKVAKVGPRGKKSLAALFIWEDTGPEKGRHWDGLAKNKLGKMGRRENKWSLLCVRKWLVNTFVWQTLCPIPAVYPIFWLKSASIFCMSILSVLYMRCSSNFTSWWTGQGVLSYLNKVNMWV